MSDGPYEFYTDDEGRRRARLKGEQEICDFCLSPEIAWSYPAREMRIDGHAIINKSDDEWGACEECAELIEARDVGGLVERCVRMQPFHHPPGAHGGYVSRYPPLPIARRNHRTNIMRFLNARSGPRTREP